MACPPWATSGPKAGIQGGSLAEGPGASYKRENADGAVAAAVAAVAELGVQLADVGAALVPPLVQVRLVLIEHRRPAVGDFGEQRSGVTRHGERVRMAR